MHYNCINKINTSVISQLLTPITSHITLNKTLQNTRYYKAAIVEHKRVEFAKEILNIFLVSKNNCKKYHSYYFPLVDDVSFLCNSSAMETLQ